MQDQSPNKYKLALYTNLSMVKLGEITSSCSALLLEEETNPHGGGPVCRLRVFGTDAAFEHLYLHLRCPSIVASIESTHPHPRTTRRELVVANGSEPLRVELVLADHVHPICVDELTGDDSDTYLRCWELLRQRARQFWTAPFIPVLRTEWVR